MKSAAFALALFALAAGCVPIAPDAACAEAANDCDQALEQPYNSFVAEDDTFGEGGTCWYSAETAKACIAECEAFVAEELEIAKGQKNNAVILACGGEL